MGIDSGMSACKCAVAGTLINVVDGYKKIEEIKPGDTVLSYNVDDLSIFTQKIVDAGSFISDCVEVDSSLSSPLSCSCTHPFWTQRGWVDAEDLTTDDIVAVLKAKLPTNKPIPQDELDFITIMIFEGSTTHGMKYFVNFDKEVVDVMRAACDSLCIDMIDCKIDGRYRFRSTFGGDKRNVRLNALLDKYGINCCQSKKKRLPKQFFSMPIEQKYRFVSLMLATDGYINTRGNMSIALASHGLIDDIKRLLNGIGISSSYRYRRVFYRKDSEKLPFDAWRLRLHKYTCSEMIDSVTFFHKQDRVDKTKLATQLNSYPLYHILPKLKNGLVFMDKAGVSYSYCGKKDWNGGDFYSLCRQPQETVMINKLDELLPYEPDLEKICNDPICWSRVTGVYNVGKQKVYYIETESENYDNQNYFLNDVITHN